MLVAFHINECLEPQWIQESRDITRQVIVAIFEARAEVEKKLIDGYDWIERGFPPRRHWSLVKNILLCCGLTSIVVVSAVG